MREAIKTDLATQLMICVLSVGVILNIVALT